MCHFRTTTNCFEPKFTIFEPNLLILVWNCQFQIDQKMFLSKNVFLECCERSLQRNHRKSSYPAENSKIWSKQSSNRYWWYSDLELSNRWRWPGTKYCLVQGRNKTRKSRGWGDHVFRPKTDPTVWLIFMTHFSVQFLLRNRSFKFSGAKIIDTNFSVWRFSKKFDCSISAVKVAPKTRNFRWVDSNFSEFWLRDRNTLEFMSARPNLLLATINSVSIWMCISRLRW